MHTSYLGYQLAQRVPIVDGFLSAFARPELEEQCRLQLRILVIPVARRPVGLSPGPRRQLLWQWVWATVPFVTICPVLQID